MRETYSFLLLPQKSEEGDITEKRPCYATRVVPTSSGIETPFYFATLCRMRQHRNSVLLRYAMQNEALFQPNSIAMLRCFLALPSDVAKCDAGPAW